MAKKKAKAGKPLNPAKLTAEDLARVLSQAGEPVTTQQIEQDLADGAPANKDGTIHLVHYAAWLVTQTK